MKTEWLSESISKDAKTIILIGPLPLDRLEFISKEFTLGILWIYSKKEITTKLPPTVFLLDIKANILQIKKELENFLLLDYDLPPTVKISQGITERFYDEYNTILNLTIAEIDSTMRARRTRIETGYTRQKQIFINLANYLTKRLPKEWNTIGHGCLGIVVGAGPSLDTTLPLLKEGIPKALIIATDSSLKALRGANLHPDFVISIDPQKTFESCSEEDYAPGIAILSSQSHVSWAKKWGANCCYLSGRVITEDWLAEKGIPKTNLLAINNAGLTAIMFANFVNTSALLCIGMDLAGGGFGQKRYAKSTNRSHIEISASHYHEIPGNFSKSVSTPFLSDWQETSDYCKNISAKKTIINFNDRGAKLEGTTLIHPKQIEELKDALNNNFTSYKSPESSLLKNRRKINGFGLNQLMCQLTTICDQIWEEINQHKIGDTESISNFFGKLFANHDKAQLLGDFAFTVMPKITKKKDQNYYYMIHSLAELKELIWRLEDAILACDPEEEFLCRFFTEKFD